MEDVIKQLLPNLAKSSPWLILGGSTLYLIAKLAFKFFKERDDKREELFKQTLTSRENFFIDELEKKDVIIHEKDGEIKQLNLRLVELIRENIEVTKNNSVLFENLKDLLKVALNSRQ